MKEEKQKKDFFKYYKEFKNIILKNILKQNVKQQIKKKEIKKIISNCKKYVKHISKTKLTKKEFDKIYIIGLELLVFENYLLNESKTKEYIKGINSKTPNTFEKYERDILRNLKRKKLKKNMKGGSNNYINPDNRHIFRIVNANINSCGSYKPYYSNGDFFDIDLYDENANQQETIQKAHITVNTTNLNESNIQGWLKNPRTTYKVNIKEEQKNEESQTPHFFGKKLFVYKESVSRYLQNKKRLFDDELYKINESDRGIHKLISGQLLEGERILPYNKNENVFIKQIPWQTDIQDLEEKKQNININNGKLFLVVHKTDDDLNDTKEKIPSVMDIPQLERNLFFKRADAIVYNKKKKELVQFLPEDKGKTKEEILQKYEDYTNTTRNMPLYHIKYTAKLFVYFEGEYVEVYTTKTMKDVYAYYSIRDMYNPQFVDNIRNAINSFLIPKYNIDTSVPGITEQLFNNLMYYFQYPQPSNRLIIHIEYINPIQVLHYQQYKLDNMYLFDDVINNLLQDSQYYLNDVIGMKYKFMLDIFSPNEKYKNIIQDLREDFIFDCKRFLLVFRKLYNLYQIHQTKLQNSSRIQKNINWGETSPLLSIIETRFLPKKPSLTSGSSFYNVLNDNNENNNENNNKNNNEKKEDKKVFLENIPNLFEQIKNLFFRTDVNILNIYNQMVDDEKGNVYSIFTVATDQIFNMYDVNNKQPVMLDENPNVKKKRKSIIKLNFKHLRYLIMALFGTSNAQTDSYIKSLEKQTKQKYSKNSMQSINKKIEELKYFYQFQKFWGIGNNNDLKIILEYFFDFGEIGYWSDKFENVFNKLWIKKKMNISNNLQKNILKCEVQSLYDDEIKNNHNIQEQNKKSKSKTSFSAKIEKINECINKLNQRENFIKIKVEEKKVEEKKNNSNSKKKLTDDEKLIDGIEKYKNEKVFPLLDILQVQFGIQTPNFSFKLLISNGQGNQNYVLYRDLFEALEDLYNFYTFANYTEIHGKNIPLNKNDIGYLFDKYRMFNREMELNILEEYLNPNNIKKYLYIHKLCRNLLKITSALFNAYGEKKYVNIAKKSYPYRAIISIINRKKMDMHNFKVMHMSKTYFNKLFLIGYFQKQDGLISEIYCAVLTPKRNHIDMVELLKNITLRPYNIDREKGETTYEGTLDIPWLFYDISLCKWGDDEECDGLIKRYLGYDVYRMKLHPEKLDKYTTAEAFNSLKRQITGGVMENSNNNIFPALQTYAVFIIKLILKTSNDLLLLYQNNLEKNYVSKLSFSNYFVPFFPDYKMSNFEVINPFEYIVNLKKQGKKWDNNIFLNYIHIIMWVFDKKFEFIYDGIWKKKIKGRDGLWWMNKEIYEKLKLDENKRGKTKLLNDFTYFNIKGEDKQGIYGIVELCGEKNGKISQQLFNECKDSIYLNCTDKGKCPSKILKNESLLFFTYSLKYVNINDLIKIKSHGTNFIKTKILNTSILKQNYLIKTQLKITPHIYPGLENSIFHMHFYLLQTSYSDLSDIETTNRSISLIQKNNEIISNILNNINFLNNVYKFTDTSYLII